MEDDKGGAAMLRLLRAIEGTLRYRVVTEGVEGSSFKHRIAKIHATSMKWLSKIVHEFRPLPDSDVEMLLRTHWAPTGVELPKNDISPEVAAAITRLTRGNFRLLARLLTQMQRVVEINQLSEFSIDVVETARENLVIGQA